VNILIDIIQIQFPYLLVDGRGSTRLLFSLLIRIGIILKYKVIIDVKL